MSARLNYYFRQKVTEAELDSGFALLEDADRNFVTDTNLVGVVEGMEVTQRGAGANLTVDVAAGKTYDKNGARIQFSATQNVNVAVDESSVTTTVAGGGNSKILSVFAKFARILSDPRTDGNSITVYFSEAEGFDFVVRQSAETVSPSPVALDPEFILLADITRVFGDTTIVNGAISTSRREDVFVTAGSPNSLREGRIGDAFADLLGFINTEVADRTSAVAAEAATRSSDDGSLAAIIAAHIADTSAAHDASAISYTGGGSGYADSGTTVATDVAGALDEIVGTVGGVGGAAKIGATAIGASYMYGSGGGTVQAQLAELSGYLDLGPRGYFIDPYTHANSPVALTSERRIEVDTTGGVVLLNLPVAAASYGYTYRIKDVKGAFGSGSVCTLVPNGAAKIDGVNANRDLSADWGAYEIYCNGTDWFLV